MQHGRHRTYRTQRTHRPRAIFIVFSPVQRWEILSQTRDRETFEGVLS